MLLVVLFHAGVPGIHGGYVGVDVFFVLSGFLITDLLLREWMSHGSVSLRSFYARRARRIIPVATLVLLVTVLASYQWLGFIRADTVAVDGEWVSVFLGNVHFASEGTNYLTANLPPSPVEQYWSLAVEEQFYVVWPSLFILVALTFPRVDLRVRFASALLVLIAASLTWSIIETSTNGTWAYYSSLTRAWELAAGALLAVSIPALATVPRSLGAALTWLGLAGIMFAAFWLDGSSSFPGWVVAVPVMATVCALAGGAVARGGGAGVILGLAPFQFLGNLSYSWYLWHWPLLIVVSGYVGRDLSMVANLGLVLVALILSYLSYHLVENPIRYAKRLARDPAVTVFLGICLIAFSLALTNLIQGPPAPTAAAVREHAAPIKPGTPAEIAAMVHQAPSIDDLPANLAPPLEELPNDVGPAGIGCNTSSPTSHPKDCVYGDPSARRTVVLFGDSHAGMWVPAFDSSARRGGWRVVLLFRPGCPAPAVHVWNLETKSPDTECDRWRAWALNRIESLDPAMVVLTSLYFFPLDFDQNPITEDEWDEGLGTVLNRLHSTRARLFVLGDTPYLVQDPPSCLAARSTDVQFCSTPTSEAVLKEHDANEGAVAAELGAKYIDVVPWFCSPDTCTAVVSDKGVYRDQGHVSATYAAWLADALGAALHFQTPRQAPPG